METITKSDNELIAEFMGASVDDDRYENRYAHFKDGPVLVQRLQYHESWDWLMPVVEKIEALGYSFEIIKHPENSTTDVYIDQQTIQTWESSKIEAVYKAVVEFIKWHNANSQTP